MSLNQQLIIFINSYQLSCRRNYDTVYIIHNCIVLRVMLNLCL